MNMVSIGIPLFIVTVSYITANKGFVTVQCKTENIGRYGQKSLLECVVRPTQEATNLQIRVVTWKKAGGDDNLVVFHRGETKQASSYSFAEPSWNDRNMNVSLLITNTTVHDEGVYTCAVLTNIGPDSTDVSLKVTASVDPDPHGRNTSSHKDPKPYDNNNPIIIISVVSTLITMTAILLIVLGVILWTRNRDKTTSVQQISKDYLSKDMTKNDLDSVEALGRSIQSLCNF